MLVASPADRVVMDIFCKTDPQRACTGAIERVQGVFGWNMAGIVWTRAISQHRKI